MVTKQNTKFKEKLNMSTGEQLLKEIASAYNVSESKKDAIEQRKAYMAANTSTHEVNGCKISLNHVDNIYTANVSDLCELMVNHIGRVAPRCIEHVLDDNSRQSKISYRDIEMVGDEILALVHIYKNKDSQACKEFGAQIVIDNPGSRRAFARSVPFVVDDDVEKALAAVYELWEKEFKAAIFINPIYTILNKIADVDKVGEAQSLLLELQRQSKLSANELVGLLGEIGIGRYAWLRKFEGYINKASAVSLSLKAIQEIATKARSMMTGEAVDDAES
jgi:hypothetical protein